MLNGFFRKFQLPVACAFNTLALEFLILLPVIEVANQINLCSVGCPLTEDPSLGKLMQTKIEMTGSKICQFLLAVLRQLTDFPQGMVMTAADSILKRLQP